MQELRQSLPAGVHLEPFYDQSTIVSDSISSVRDAVILGVILSSVVLVLFLRDWGTSLVAGLVIPVTLCITFTVLRLTGQTFNLMTLGGLAAAVGLVIDDAIVVLENIVLHREAGQSRTKAIRSALRELTVPLVGSTVTPIVVFLPLISITGVTGSFFRALAITMTASLFKSVHINDKVMLRINADFLNNVFNMPGPPNPNGTTGLISMQNSANAPRTLCDIFTIAASCGKPNLLISKVGGAWKSISAADFGFTVRALSLGLNGLGVQPGDRVAILSENRPEWAMADYAALCAGAYCREIGHGATSHLPALLQDARRASATLWRQRPLHRRNHRRRMTELSASVARGL